MLLTARGFFVQGNRGPGTAVLIFSSQTEEVSGSKDLPSQSPLVVVDIVAKGTGRWRRSSLTVAMRSSLVNYLHADNISACQRVCASGSLTVHAFCVAYGLHWQGDPITRPRSLKCRDGLGQQLSRGTSPTIGLTVARSVAGRERGRSAGLAALRDHSSSSRGWGGERRSSCIGGCELHLHRQ